MSTCKSALFPYAFQGALAAVLALSGCHTVVHPAAPAQIPGGTASAGGGFSASTTPPIALSEQIAALMAQSEELKGRITALEEQNQQLQQQSQEMRSQLIGVHQSMGVLGRALNVRIARPKTTSSTPLPAASAYQAALQHYNARRYANAVALLNPYSTGGDGSIEAQNGMYLLALSRQQLKHCESAIAVSKMLVRRFPQSAHAPNALLITAQCQIRLQQKDIARNTLRNLTAVYPNSSAAQTAHQMLK